MTDKKNFAYFCLESGRERTAYDWFMRAASTQDPEAQFMIGVIYMSGSGKKQNTQKAKEWFEKAAEGGYPAAQTKLKELLEGAQKYNRQPRRLNKKNHQKDSSAADDTAKAGQDTIQGDNAANDTNNMDDADHKNDQQNGDSNRSQNDHSAGKSFSDLVFKKDENGNRFCTVHEYDPPDSDSFNTISSSNAEDQAESYGAYQYDTGFYKNIPVKCIHPDPEADPYEQLEALIGLKKAKHQISLIEKRILFEQKREAAKLVNFASSNHFVFKGNPGTGKTEMARLLGHILQKTGVLDSGHVIEVDRSDLIGGWVGHSALKTEAVIEKAMGGILFIDEAYSLNHDAGWDFGEEVIATLLKAMEDKRSEFVVVMAGYGEEMDRLIASNPGLKSRFRHHIDFEDFGSAELLQIFEKFCREHDYTPSEDALKSLENTLKSAEKQAKLHSGNARLVRNVFESTIENMAVRVVNQDLDDLKTIHFSDIPPYETIFGTAKKTLL